MFGWDASVFLSRQYSPKADPHFPGGRKNHDYTSPIMRVLILLILTKVVDSYGMDWVITKIIPWALT